jgi:hypothetical protein
VTEEWRLVVGFPDYEVSDHGRVRSLDHLKWSGPVGYTLQKGRVLKRSVDGRGYLNVNLRCEGRRAITRTVHSLVADAFIGPCPEGLICCHNDDNKTNPLLSNLRYDTRAENNADTYRNGIRKAEDNSPRAKKAAITRTIRQVGICRARLVPCS